MSLSCSNWGLTRLYHCHIIATLCHKGKVLCQGEIFHSEGHLSKFVHVERASLWRLGLFKQEHKHVLYHKIYKYKRPLWVWLLLFVLSVKYCTVHKTKPLLILRYCSSHSSIIHYLRYCNIWIQVTLTLTLRNDHYFWVILWILYYCLMCCVII